MEAGSEREVRASRPEPLVRVAGPTASDRARQAMRCPYCHDDARSGALVCARPGCGAIYHVACWEECGRRRGCVALGCGSPEVRAVGRLGLLTRFGLLLLAAWLFPPRLLAAVREGGDARPELRERARELGRRLWSEETGLPPHLRALWALLQVLVGLSALPVAILGAWLGATGAIWLQLEETIAFAAIGGFFAGLGAALAALRWATWPGVFVLLLARGLLRGELERLDRAADPKAP